MLMVEYMERSRACFVWTNSKYVAMHWCMFEFECAIEHDTPWHDLNCTLAYLWTTMAIIQRGCWFNIWNVAVCVDFELTESMSVLLHVWLWMYHYLIMVHHDTFTWLLFKYTTMAITSGSALLLMLVEYTKRYRVGFGWTVCTLVLVHVWILTCNTWLCADVDVTWITGTGHAGLREFWLWFNTYCVYMKRYRVGFGRTACALVLVYVWIWSCHRLVYHTLSQFHTRLLLNYNDNHIWLCTHVDVDWTYGTILCWLLTNRKYVGIDAFLRLSVSLLLLHMMHYDIITIAHSPATQIHYDDNNLRLCADVDTNWIHETVLCWLWMNRKYVDIGACLN